MNIENIIKNRRNIKPEIFIKDKIIDNETIKTIIEAANWAPTHGKTEPWRFFIFDNQNIEKFATLHANFYKKNPRDCKTLHC
jgi:nitroreductase